MRVWNVTSEMLCSTGTQCQRPDGVRNAEDQADAVLAQIFGHESELWRIPQYRYAWATRMQ
jgi:hypothetical protein